MPFIYTQADLQEDVNRGLQGKIGMLTNPRDTINRAVRRVLSDVDLRSTTRVAALSPDLFPDVFQYASLSDLKGQKIIDIPAQAKRFDKEWDLVPHEEFELNKETKDGLVSIDTHDGRQNILLSSAIDTSSTIVSSLDSLTAGGGTWQLAGAAENVRADLDDYVKGNGSIAFDIDSSASAPRAGIQNLVLSQFDITDYLHGSGAAFVWAYLPTVTGVNELTLRIGSDTSNRYEKSVSTRHDGDAFQVGWNLIRFDLKDLTTNGTPVDDEMIYVALLLEKDLTLVDTDNFRFDYLVLRRGKKHNLRYYSKYGWQGSDGTFKENAESGDDLLVADADEYEMFVAKALYYAGGEADLRDTEIARFDGEYKELLAIYLRDNPSEAALLQNVYYNY